ncbi:MAG: TIGR04211 family SH3 domain-containing protein, partial [Proteobacteria bacterium]|nr:TIGR04211 family SH3 domain-containing protein [Pseudomonadota bacterium]
MAAIFSMLVVVPASAKTMYITDVLWITLRTGPSNEHKVVGMLKSNEEVEVLEEQEDWTKVRLKNGKEGYALSRFLTSDVPKSLVISGLQRRVEKLKGEISSLKEVKKRLGESKLELGSSLSSREKELAKLKRDYEELKSGSAEYIKVK